MRIIISVILLGLVQVGMSGEPHVVKNQNLLLSTSLNCIDAGQFALWVGSDKGINRVEVLGDSIFEVSARQTSKAVLSICNDNEYLWVGIAQKGLYLFNKRTYVFKGRFKKQLGLTNITSITKVGGELFLKTKSNSNYVIDLSDTSLHSSDVNNSIKHNANGVVSHRGQRYQASSVGLMMLQVNSKNVSSNASEDTIAVVQKEAVVPKESQLGASGLVKQEGLIKSDEIPVEQEKDILTYLWMLLPVLGLYSFLLVKIVSRKYKRDIKVLEDEILKRNKQA